VDPAEGLEDHEAGVLDEVLEAGHLEQIL
jgi:hypothetical protein